MPTLYDHLGRPVDLGRLHEEEAGPTLTGVRQVMSGHPAQGLTPVRLARLLRDAEDGDPTAYLELAEEMEEKDCHYRSVLSTRKLQVSGLEITVEAATDAAEDQRAADLVRDVLTRDELRDELFDVLDAVGKGFSLTEIVWDVEGRQWTPARLEWRDQRWFAFAREDGRTPLLRSEGGQLVPLSPYKYVAHIHKSKSGLPIRGGLARPVAWGYLFKNFDIRSWVQFAEIFGVPLRVGRYGPGATDSEKATLLRAVRNISTDAAAIIPESMGIEFIEAKLSGSIDLFEKLAGFLDRQTSKAVLGQTGTTDVGQHVGTAEAHEKVRGDIETADARQLSIALTRDIARPVVDLNLGPRKLYPRIKVYRPDEEDMDKLADRLVKLVPLGLAVEASIIRDKLGLPDPPPDAVCLRAPKEAAEAETAATGATGAPVVTGSPRAAHSRELPGQAAPEPRDAVDVAVAEELAEWQPLVDPLIEPVRRLLAECADLDEFLRRLPEAVAGQDVAALTEHLARLAFAARLAGETGAALGD